MAKGNQKDKKYQSAIDALTERNAALMREARALQTYQSRTYQLLAAVLKVTGPVTVPKDDFGASYSEANVKFDPNEAGDIVVQLVESAPAEAPSEPSGPSPTTPEHVAPVNPDPIPTGG